MKLFWNFTKNKLEEHFMQFEKDFKTVSKSMT